MSAKASESVSPLRESQAAARRKRLAHLAYMVFVFMVEKYQNTKCHEFEGLEDAPLLDALRVCSSYTDQINCLDFGDRLIVKIEGIDGHSYLIQFSLFGPGFSLQASRVRVTSLTLAGGKDSRVDSIDNTLDILDDHSRSIKLDKVSTDRAFLIGMSLVIRFMDDQGDDPDEDARLAPLVAQIMPRAEEWRKIRARKIPSSINYDEEGDQPF